jgi:predicted RNA-binding Zn ribbon-like protein
LVREGKSHLKLREESGKTIRRRAPRFELIAGNVALDFVNTLDDRPTQPKELLATYADLLRFGEDSGVLDAAQFDRLLERKHLAEDATQEVLLQARELREDIHDVFRAILKKRPVPAAALAKLNAAAQSAAGRMRLVAVKGGFVWRFEDFGGVDAMLWPIARAAAELLASDQLPYVRACSSKTCEWFFLDTSKNHRRRWCDMANCGNRAKVRRFYARQKKESC